MAERHEAPKRLKVYGTTGVMPVRCPECGVVGATVDASIMGKVEEGVQGDMAIMGVIISEVTGIAFGTLRCQHGHEWTPGNALIGQLGSTEDMDVLRTPGPEGG